MKKFMFICILCGVLLTGCESKTEVATMHETQTSTAPVTTVTTFETAETSATTVKSQATDTTTSPIDTTTVTTNTPKATEKPSTTSKKATTKAPVTKTTTVTEAPKSKTTTTTTTTVVPISAKRLDATFKAELVECAKEYCSTIGYIYSDNYADWGCTPSPKNTSWDIPIRTVSATTNEKIKEYVANSISFLKRSGYDDLVVCLYFEDDSRASGEWRIYVLF